MMRRKSDMKKLALGLLAVTLLCGCGTKEAKISMEEAKEAALKEFQGDIIQSNKDEDDGKVVYEFIIDNGPNRCDVEIDGNTGEVLKSELEDSRLRTVSQPSEAPSQESSQPQNREEIITEDEAKEAALARSGAGSVVKCELDTDDGNVRYEIEIRDGSKEIDVEVDAVTKEILHYEEEIID